MVNNMVIEGLKANTKYKSTIQFIKFGIVGFSNTIISYAVYFFCVWIGMHYQLANIVGFIISVLNAYYWSSRFVFVKQTGEERGLVSSLIKTFVAYSFTGIALSAILLWLLIDKMALSEYIAPLLILLITVPLNFILNKYWSFKSKILIQEEE